MPLNKDVRPNLLAAEGGQTIVLVALMMTILFGFVGLVIDFGWYEINLTRIQRAADAGALAGSVYLPGNVAGGQTAAAAAAVQNGYTNGSGGVTVAASQDVVNTQMMNVVVTAPIRTFFMRIFGVSSLTASRNARSEFILPVPMGSPQSYFGVHLLCRNSDAAPSCPSVPSATGVGTLMSQGIWAAVETKGSQRSSGDAYSTYYNGGSSLNTGYDAGGYSYVVEFPAGTSGGSVWIFDPVFCATGQKSSSGTNRLGVGDVWIGDPSSSSERQVTTEFKLWNMNGTPYSTSDDVLVASDGGIFTNMDNVDGGANYQGNDNYSLSGSYNGGSSSNCSANAYHNVWWQMASGLAAGDYRLQVSTSAGSTSQDAVNNFAIQATAASGSGMRVYGQSRMCVFITISGTSTFYLAQIDAVHAGKTLEIKLFDPGDISNTSLRVKQPGASGYTNATFSWTATGCSGSGCTTSGTNVTSLVTSSAGGTNYYNNQWITISIVLPTTYSAPTPPGEPGPGWWKIEYSTGSSGQDVTTWQVNIRGNPVHLVTP